MFDLKDLRCFVVTYELRGFGRAAKALNTVQSNVSARIQRLEQVLGAPLFVRMHRRISPTTQGDALYKYAQRVLGDVDEIQRAFHVKKIA